MPLATTWQPQEYYDYRNKQDEERQILCYHLHVGCKKKKQIK